VSFGPFVFSARALHIHSSNTMYDLDAIEAINVDQLVTPLDRILLAGGRPRRRPSRPTMDLTAAAEKTLQMRAQRVVGRSARSTFGVAAALAGATWLSVAVACLLA
jgi:hypothetical protein